MPGADPLGRGTRIIILVATVPEARRANVMIPAGRLIVQLPSLRHCRRLEQTRTLEAAALVRNNAIDSTSMSSPRPSGLTTLITAHLGLGRAASSEFFHRLKLEQRQVWKCLLQPINTGESRPLVWLCRNVGHYRVYGGFHCPCSNDGSFSVKSP